MDLKKTWKKIAETSREWLKPAQRWALRHLPPGVRLLAGLLLMAGGVFAFLPVLGIWMLPLGIAIAALDIRPIWRWLSGKRPYWYGKDEGSEEDD